MKRDYSDETAKRISFIRNALSESACTGIVFANSGGKDAALTGILCKLACDNTVGIILPCESRRNFESDKEDALAVAQRFGIETRIADLTDIKKLFVETLGDIMELNETALMNIAPRLRMITLYALSTENRLVAGTGNRSEYHMGYFTKWGDGAYDFNPIADLTVTEIYEYLRYLGCPDAIIEKAPSAGLFEGQTDEADMGVTYAAIDSFLLEGRGVEQDLEIINRYNKRSGHKRRPPLRYGE